MMSLLVCWIRPMFLPGVSIYEGVSIGGVVGGIIHPEGVKSRGGSIQMGNLYTDRGLNPEGVSI